MPVFQVAGPRARARLGGLRRTRTRPRNLNAAAAAGPGFKLRLTGSHGALRVIMIPLRSARPVCRVQLEGTRRPSYRPHGGDDAGVNDSERDTELLTGRPGIVRI
jgi:hypothetical protein